MTLRSLDLDGVVHVGHGAVRWAAESLDEALAQQGMRSAFVTNNAARPDPRPPWLPIWSS